MNSRQRYDAMLTGQPVDFLPRVPILMRFAAEYIGRTYGQFVSDWRVLTESQIRCAEDFGIDQLSVISDPYRETAGFGADILIEDTGPSCPTPPLADNRDPAQLAQPDPAAAPRMADRVCACEAFGEYSRGRHSILGWIEGPAAEAADLRGVTNFMLDLIDDPVYADDLMARCVDVAIDFAAAQVTAGADTIGIGDAVASQVSTDLYEQFIRPHEQRLLQAVRDLGARVRLHICGDITHLLAGLATLPIDILDVDYMVDMSAVRRAMPAGVTLAGNIDPVAGVLHGSPQSIRNTLVETARQIGRPAMINAGCEIPPGTPHENLHALCQPVILESPASNPPELPLP